MVVTERVIILTTKGKIIATLTTLGVIVVIFVSVWSIKARKPINVEAESTAPIEIESVWWNITETSSAKVDAFGDEIPENYMLMPGTDDTYMILSNNKITKYVRKQKQDDGSYVWYDINPDIPEYLSKVKNTDNIFSYEINDGVMYFEYTIDKNGNPTLSEIKESDIKYNETEKETTSNSETKYETKTVDGWVITYKTVITKSYDTDGNLINTKKDGPTEVSKVQASSVNNIEKTLNDELEAMNTKFSFNTDFMDKMLALLNAERKNAGYSELKFDASSYSYKIAMVMANALAEADDSKSSEVFNKITSMFPNCSISSLIAPQNMGSSLDSIVKSVHEKLQSDDGSKSARMNKNCSSIGIIVIPQNGNYYIAEVLM